MGSSKKHKDKDREHKHKRHKRSRSREKHKKEHKRRRKGYEDVNEYSPQENQHGTFDYNEEAQTYQPDYEQIQGEEESKQPVEIEEGEGAGLSLSIAEANKLRARLGLKPLDVGGTKTEGAAGGTSSAGTEDVHVPAINWAEKKKSEDLREKMALMKEKRKIHKHLSKIKTLGESDSDDESAALWVKRSRQQDAERRKAEERAKLLEEMDNEFNIGSLVAEEFASADNKKQKYSSRDLKGLRVEHAASSFSEGGSTVLVLKDRGVLDEDGEGDTLVNMNMLDEERHRRNVELRKKKPDYKPYDEPQLDEYGMMKPRDVLEKYDEEISGIQKEHFQLEGGGGYNDEHERRMEDIRTALRQKGESLTLPVPRLASEYYTEQEMATFKKPKKKKQRTLRQKKAALTADDLLNDDLGREASASMDHGSRNPRSINVSGAESLNIKEEPPGSYEQSYEFGAESDNMVKSELDDDTDDLQGPSEDLTGLKVEEESTSKDLAVALSKARRLKQSASGRQPGRDDEHIARRIKHESQDDDDDADLPFNGGGTEFEDAGGQSSSIVLYSTSEFCRSLGDLPTQPQSSKQDNDSDLDDWDEEMRKLNDEDDDGELGGTSAGQWQSVEIDSRPVEISVEESRPVLDDEPIVTSGIGSALLLASKKGYLDKEVKKVVTAASKKVQIEALNYSIEDKRYDDIDEKYSRKRDRYSGGGMMMDFREKDGYKPDIKLEYFDDQGKPMPPKEAFRILSHRFHGKGPGKKKLEKRMKKLEEEQLMKCMNSTDTPLNMVHMLKERQKTEKSPYLVLSGGGKGFGLNSLTK